MKVDWAEVEGDLQKLPAPSGTWMECARILHVLARPCHDADPENSTSSLLPARQEDAADDDTQLGWLYEEKQDEGEPPLQEAGHPFGGSKFTKLLDVVG